ncbi:hypothetical protein STEG23_031339, partial [Scotinomys teguina]
NYVNLLILTPWFEVMEIFKFDVKTTAITPSAAMKFPQTSTVLCRLGADMTIIAPEFWHPNWPLQEAGVFSSSRTGVFSSCCLALDSSSSFPCPAFQAIAKSVILYSSVVFDAAED